MRYRTYTTLTLAAFVALSAACSDTPTASREPAAGAWGGPQLERTQTSVTTVVSDTTWVQFEYQPSSGGTYRIGDHGVIFPKRSICDPDLTTYGVDQWDAPCTPAKRKVVITAKAWSDELGHPHVDFSPALRFVPSEDPNQWVVLFLRDKAAKSEELASRLSIYWSPSPDQPAVDESITDPTLATYFTRNGGGFVYRRVKHFSGFLVVARDATSSTDAVY